LQQIVDRFRPQGPLAQHWDLVRPTVTQTLARSTLRGEATFRKHLTHLGYFVAWTAQQGLPLSPATVTRANVDEYTRIGMPHASGKSRADRRARLRWLADQINPGQAPDTGVPVARPSIRPPYIPEELATIRRVAQTQPTARQRRNLSTCVALGAGAGLDSADLRHLRSEHIVDCGAGGFLVHVPGLKARTVPVLASFEPLLRAAVLERPSGELLLGRREDRRNIAARAVSAAVLLGDCPRIVQSRLRASWLAELMRHRVPLAVIMRAAGLRSARTLGDLLPHLELDDANHDIVQLLRGRGWAA
jgi:hypothetical protein